MSAVAVYSYSHSVSYVTDNILKSLKDVLVLSGLDPQKLVGDHKVLHAGIKRWIESEHLDFVTLEIYHPKTNALIKRWDIAVTYSWSSEAGNFWVDPEALRYAISKEGLLPSEALYSVIVKNKVGRPDVDGWSATEFRSTDGMVRQSIGTGVEHNGLSANMSYWRTK
ncbi:HORMA domain containing protein [Acidovorax sp. ACV01]|uniref:HORMA domain containing protein n=1 Tax=Acidovorax sp. ACV01 TaxID=2769311 RepID=UPI001780C1E6|nr:HORMA domain containing protein [Acidovorax sp. ACV01]MBD9395349.1 HORMA domain containing protein [Acidovorax sp. ACV01]